VSNSLNIQANSLIVGFSLFAYLVSNMDLSILPDDQLLQLIEAVTKEVSRRAIAIQGKMQKRRF
jgi:hypothetical protein